MKKAVKTSSIVEHHLESWASCHRRTLVERPIRVPKHCQKVKASSITSQQAQCGEMQPQCEKGHCRISSSGQSPNTVKTVTRRTEVVARQWDGTHTTHSVRTVCQGIIPFLPGRPKQLAMKVGVSVFQRASMNEGGQGRAFLGEAGPFAQSPNDCRSPTGQHKANNVLTRVASLRKPGLRASILTLGSILTGSAGARLGSSSTPKGSWRSLPFLLQRWLAPNNYIFQSSRSSLGFAGNFNLSHATSEPFLLSFSLISH